MTVSKWYTFRVSFTYRLKEGNYSCYINELLELLEIIRKLPVELRAKKVNNKDRNLLRVHKMAKYSLYELPVDFENFYLETSDDEEKKFLNKKRRGTKDLKAHDKQNWFDYVDAEIIHLPVAAIVIEEDIHLKSNKINLGGTLKDFKKNGSIDKPIAVRKSGESYVLVAGMSRLCAAKLLSFNTIPAIIQDIYHIEFLLRYVM